MIVLPGGSYQADHAHVPYTPEGVATTAHQTLSVWLPDPATAPRPPGGYAWIASTFFGGYTQIPPGSVLDPAFFTDFDDLLRRGIAVIHFGLTGPNLPLGFGAPNDTVPGKGLFHPPGTAGWDDFTRPNHLQDCAWMVQLVKRRATEWGLNPELGGLDGESAGATTVALLAMGPDLADPSRQDHLAESTVVRAVRVRISQPDFAVYDAAIPAPFWLNPFPDAGGDITQDRCAQYSDAPAGYLDAHSFLRSGFGTQVDRDRNAQGLAVYLHQYQQPLAGMGYALTGVDGTQTGKVWDAQGFDADSPITAHPAEGGVVTKARLLEIEANGFHTSFSRLAVDQETYVALQADDPAQLVFVDAVLPKPPAPSDKTPEQVQFENDWWELVLAPPPAPPKKVPVLPPLQEMVDVRLDLTQGGADLELVQGDLARERGLATAVLVSLFSDGRAPADEPLPDGSEDPRGWWAEAPRDRWGSLLWLLERSKVTEQTVARAIQAAREGLEWVVREGLAGELEVTGQRVGEGRDRIELEVRLGRPTRPRWPGVWEALEQRVFESDGVAVQLIAT